MAREPIPWQSYVNKPICSQNQSTAGKKNMLFVIRSSNPNKVWNLFRDPSLRREEPHGGRELNTYLVVWRGVVSCLRITSRTLNFFRMLAKRYHRRSPTLSVPVILRSLQFAPGHNAKESKYGTLATLKKTNAGQYVSYFRQKSSKLFGLQQAKTTQKLHCSPQVKIRSRLFRLIWKGR